MSGIASDASRFLLQQMGRVTGRAQRTIKRLATCVLSIDDGNEARRASGAEGPLDDVGCQVPTLQTEVEDTNDEEGHAMMLLEVHVPVVDKLQKQLRNVVRIPPFALE